MLHDCLNSLSFLPLDTGTNEEQSSISVYDWYYNVTFIKKLSFIYRIDSDVSSLDGYKSVGTHSKYVQFWL